MATLVFSTADLPPDSYLVIRPWSRVGSPGQSFYLASGYNAYAENTVMVEFILVLQKVRVVYLRHFLGLDFVEPPPLSFDAFWAEENPLDQTQIDMMFPEIGICFTRERYEDSTFFPPDRPLPPPGYAFDLELDLSQLFQIAAGKSDPFNQLCYTKLSLHFSGMDEITIRTFMSDLADEINRVWLENRHPDPAQLPSELSRWGEVEQLNARAYDRVANSYVDQMLSNPVFQVPFYRWLRRLPPGGRVLEVGCGRGEPILRQLLDHGLDVTAIESSANMYAKAQAAFPAARLINASVLDLNEVDTYDAVLSINSLVYLDPVDLRFALLRVHRALKPGGVLLLHGWKPSPRLVEGGFVQVLNQNMWSWVPDVAALSTALSEYGWFEVESVRNVNPYQVHDWLESFVETTQYNFRALMDSYRTAWGGIRVQPHYRKPVVRAAYLISARKR